MVLWPAMAVKDRCPANGWDIVPGGGNQNLRRCVETFAPTAATRPGVSWGPAIAAGVRGRVPRPPVSRRASRWSGRGSPGELTLPPPNTKIIMY